MRLWLPYVRTGSGSEMYMLTLAEALREAGHEVVQHPLPWHVQYAPGRLRRLQPPEGTDVTYAETQTGFALKRAGPKLALVAHHCVFDPAYRPYRSWRQAMVHELLVRRLERKSLEVADGVVAVSAYTADSLARAHDVARPSVILNGIDTEFFTPAPEPAAPKANDAPFELLFVGNLIRRKGADLLPRIMAHLGPGFVLRYTSGLRTRSPFGEIANMVPLGRLSREGLREAYRRADVLLFPTRFEGFGYAVAESMACGTPAVTTHCSSLPELVDNGVSGRLCPIDDVGAFANAVQELAADRPRLSEMGKAARERAERQFGLERMVREYAKFFECLIEGQ